MTIQPNRLKALFMIVLLVALIVTLSFTSVAQSNNFRNESDGNGIVESTLVDEIGGTRFRGDSFVRDDEISDGEEWSEDDEEEWFDEDDEEWSEDEEDEGFFDEEEEWIDYEHGFEEEEESEGEEEHEYDEQVDRIDRAYEVAEIAEDKLVFTAFVLETLGDEVEPRYLVKRLERALQSASDGAVKRLIRLQLLNAYAELGESEKLAQLIELLR